MESRASLDWDGSCTLVHGWMAGTRARFIGVAGEQGLQVAPVHRRLEIKGRSPPVTASVPTYLPALHASSSHNGLASQATVVFLLLRYLPLCNGQILANKHCEL